MYICLSILISHILFSILKWMPQSKKFPKAAKKFIREYLQRLHDMNPSKVYQLGSCFMERVKARAWYQPQYPSSCYDNADHISAPIIFLDDAIGAATEGRAIRIGLGLGFLTNVRVEGANLEDGTNSFARRAGHRVCDIRNPGTIYVNPSRYPSIEEHHNRLAAARLAMSSRPPSEMNDNGTRYASMLFISLCMIHSLSIPFLLLYQ